MIVNTKKNIAPRCIPFVFLTVLLVQQLYFSLFCRECITIIQITNFNFWKYMEKSGLQSYDVTEQKSMFWGGGAKYKFQKLISS